jgi:hypothetical protein
MTPLSCQSPGDADARLSKHPLFGSETEPAAYPLRNRTTTFDAMRKVRPDPMPREAIEVMLEMLAPDEPFMRVDAMGVPYCPTCEDWPQSELEKGAKYRGYQPDRAYQGFLKFGVSWSDARESVRRAGFVNIAKSIWSREIQVGKTKRQFVDWMPLYLNRPAASSSWPRSSWRADLDFFREKYGMFPHPYGGAVK